MNFYDISNFTSSLLFLHLQRFVEHLVSATASSVALAAGRDCEEQR
ncbi:hypothetical protein TNCT_543641, partial [Trichonephila clavata]